MAEQQILYQEEAHTLLGDVIEGSITFRESLDTIVEGLKEVPANPRECDNKSFKRFEDLIGLVDALSEEELDSKVLRNTAVMISAFKFLKKGAFKNAALTAVGGVLCYVPIVAPVAWVAMCYSWWKFTQYGLVIRIAADAAKNPEKALAPLYEAADSLDAVSIDSSFVFDIFCSSRPRFENVYAALPPEERKAVDSRLYGFLGAGGMPGMDEIQLREYLTGIMGNAPEMVKEVPQEIAVESSEAPAEPFNQSVNPYKPFWLRSTM